ncbi:MAG TPA: ABC transporter permease [Solirubrobacteraceae bacterium]|nr:ABC transporter permease [Solirubrobacteraceae bacterium]
MGVRLRAALRDARHGVRARRRRSALTGLGIALAAAMLVAALVVSDSLGFGFDRAAKAADLPDIIVRFDPVSSSRVAQHITALPDVAAYSLRQEVTSVGLQAGNQFAGNGDVEVVGAGPHGYAIVAGRDLSSRPGEVVVEKGLADAWGLKLGSTMDIDGLGEQRIVGFSESPDNVSYPLAVPRVYVSATALDGRFGAQANPQVNLAEIWLRDPANLNEVLVQARATSYGLQGLRFVTRAGVRVLLDQAAGIVIDLLVALSLIALATAGVLLAASARAEVQRRLRAIGVRRAVGASRGHLVLVQALESLFVAAPAATVGAVAGVLATYGPTGRLLVLLNEPAPGLALAPALIAAWLAAIAIPVLAAAWPAWRAAGRPPVALLRGGDLVPAHPHGHGGPGRFATPRAGLTVLGARLAGARRTRLIATAATLGFSTAFVLLMLALASALNSLETDPGALGKRYQLTANLPASAAAHVRTIPGVQAAAPRYETQAVDSFSLGETIDVIAYPGNHTIFEAPPLVSGRRLRGEHEAEVGLGLSQALGLNPGATLAIQLDSGAELRLRVAGVVSSLDDDGRVAYVPAGALLAADPSASGEEEIAVRLKPGANAAAVTAALGPSATPATGAIGRGVPLVAVLRSILRAVAIVDGLVCLYALIQACALTVQERRRTVSVLRAFGAGGPAVRRLLAGAVVALVVPAAILGVVLERLVLGPALARLAASYVTLSLGASGLEIALVLAGLALAGAVAVVWVARQATRENVIAGLGAQ